MKEESTLKKSTSKKIDFSDIPETTSEFWADAEVRTPIEKTAISIRIDNWIFDISLDANSKMSHEGCSGASCVAQSTSHIMVKG